MMDGYGDEDLGQMVEEVEPLIRYLAAQRVEKTSPIYEDVIQEGLVWYWRTLKRKPGQQKAYYVQAAKGRMLDIITGHSQMSGSEGGRLYRPKTVNVDWAEADTGLVLGFHLLAAEVLEGVEWAYHRGQIAQALSDLPAEDRDFVVQRFWHGKTPEEITAERGALYGSLTQRWHKSIRPKLRRSLAVLEAR